MIPLKKIINVAKNIKTGTTKVKHKAKTIKPNKWMKLWKRVDKNIPFTLHHSINLHLNRPGLHLSGLDLYDNSATCLAKNF